MSERIHVNHSKTFFCLFEAPGPCLDCRSHFCGSNRGIESFWNLQGTSFVTKQCPERKNRQRKQRAFVPLEFTGRRKGVAWTIEKYYTVVNKYNLYTDSFPPPGEFQRYNRHFFMMSVFPWSSRCFLERFGTLFWRHFGILEVSGALNDTIRILSARSTIWEWSRSCQSSNKHENIGNTSKILEKMKRFFRIKNRKM